MVITRFAVEISNGGGRHLNESWLRRRAQIFAQYCAPSVRWQSNQDFAWIVVVDARAPAFVAEEVASAAQSTDLHILRVREGETWHEALATTLRAMVRPSDMLVSTRLDSDDLLAANYLETVQEHARPERNVILPNGVRFDLNDGRLVEVSKHAFENLCSTTGRHVHEFEHSTVQQHFSSIVVPDRFAWAQLIHGGNLANRSMKGRPLRAAGDLTDGLLRPRRPSSQEVVRFIAREAVERQRSRLARASRALGLR